MYTHTRPDTGQIFYVGIGVASRPFYKFNRNNLWHKIVDKNNGEFIVNIICENMYRDFCVKAEVGLIKSYGRINNKTGILCNLTDGGEGNSGGVLSEATKIKCGSANKGRKLSVETRAKISEKVRGRKHSEESKKKMSCVQSGHAVSNETRRKISETKKGKKQSDIVVYQMMLRSISKVYVLQQICRLSGAVLAEFVSATIASRRTGIFKSNIKSAANGTVKSAGGFLWRKSYDLSGLDKLIRDQIAV